VTGEERIGSLRRPLADAVVADFGVGAVPSGGCVAGSHECGARACECAGVALVVPPALRAREVRDRIEIDRAPRGGCFFRSHTCKMRAYEIVDDPR
jgi:hypothetical protein